MLVRQNLPGYSACMKALIAVAIACTLLLPSRLLAWNDTGHMTIALIAYRQLNDAQRQKVADILRQHPHYKLFLTANVPEHVNADEWAFMRASTWPDFVRPSRAGTPGELFKGPEITHFHQGPWHYITINWAPPSERDKIDATTLPARQEPNILTALDGAMKQLKSPDTKPDDRAVALAWLEHLCGDVQQPLHACSMVSFQYPNGDKGGNDEAVRAGGNVMRLHAVWDDALGNSDSYVALDFLANLITEDPRLSPQKLTELQADRTFDSWAEESYQYAIAFAYLNGRLRTAPMAAYDRKELTYEQVPNLPPSYMENAHALAQRRVALGGYRLAEQIKTALSQ